MGIQLPSRADSAAHIQFFDNGQDPDLLASIDALRQAGFTVETLPTSGAPAIWIGPHEVAGHNAIQGAAEQLLRKRLA